MKRLKMREVNKKAAAIITGILLVALALPFFAAFEAHIVNVRAKIENALSVSPKVIDFGTIFPNESFTGEDHCFTVSLSESFLDQAQTRVKDVNYLIRNKSKGHTGGTGADNASYWNDHNLCPYITVDKKSSETDSDTTISANLDKSLTDTSDVWCVKIPEVPAFLGQQSQGDLGDPGFPKEYDGDIFGCDLWIEVTGFSYY